MEGYTEFVFKGNKFKEGTKIDLSKASRNVNWINYEDLKIRRD